MEVLVVTGLCRNAEAIQNLVYNLVGEGYKHIDNPASCDNHPRDITTAVERNVLVLKKFFPGRKFYIKTNSDHVINALRVLRFNGKIDVLKIKHFGLEGKVYDIEVDADGEPSEYPECFLDEWPNMMAQLCSGEKKEGVAK